MTEHVRNDGVKNPHAVALGRMGGAKGGRARAAVLTPRRRAEIAKLAGAARADALTPEQRSESARRAARARWEKSKTPSTIADTPLSVRRLLGAVGLMALHWNDPAHRYLVAKEVLVRGTSAAKRWLASMMTRPALRRLVAAQRGAECSEPERARLRAALGLTTVEIPPAPSRVKRAGQ